LSETGKLVLIVEDDGEGISEEKMEDLFGASSGIGVSNVKERLEVLFGENYRMSVESKLGQGTRTEIEIPTTRP
jgi:two-component system LytT family sensor kinase